MTRRIVAVLSLAVTLSYSGSRIAAQAATGSQFQEPPPPAYMLKASSKWAREIDEVLAKFARPLELAVPASSTPEAYLSEMCADNSVKIEHSELKDPAGKTVVLMSPCVRVRRDVKVQIKPGDTLEALAIRSGLPPSTAASYKVISSANEKPRTVDPADLPVGDFVVFPEVPMWTNVVASPAVAGDRLSLVRALANAIRCTFKDPEACLKVHGIELLNRASVPKATPVPKGFQSELFQAALLSERQSALPSAPRASVSAVRTMGFATTAAAAPPPPPPPAPAPMLALLAATVTSNEPPAGTIPVARQQWPYDVKLLGEIITDSMAGMSDETTIGVADGGLANFMGGPLAEQMYRSTVERNSALENNRKEPNSVDDDTNEWIDDLFGAGVPRYNELLVNARGTGDLGLCKGNEPPFKTWKSLILASHGTAVSSIAGGNRVRKDYPNIREKMPRLRFFRMLPEACTESAEFRVAAAEITSGFEYLLDHGADIINISYKIDHDEATNFKDKVFLRLPYESALLILSAGNDGKLLDNTDICPQCLGDDKADRGGNAATRTIVVGAASRELRRESSSNHGEQTVKMFAPSDAVDGIDLVGQDMPSTEIATSYAAPYVAFAAALIRSFGAPNGVKDIRDRLEAAIWPLEGHENNYRIGVADVVKAAAVRHHAVEVKEQDDDGTWVRRTYVGKLLTPLVDITLCEGQAFTEESYHAVRIGEPTTDGGRSIHLYPRAKNTKTHRRTPFTHSIACRPSGDLRLKTISGEVMERPLSRVTMIQLPWIK